MTPESAGLSDRFGWRWFERFRQVVGALIVATAFGLQLFKG